MKDPTYQCPVCASEEVYAVHEQAFMVNTHEHYCHMVKTQDPDAKAGCTSCRWVGLRMQLREKQPTEGEVT